MRLVNSKIQRLVSLEFCHFITNERDVYVKSVFFNVVTRYARTTLRLKTFDRHGDSGASASVRSHTSCDHKNLYSNRA